MRQTPGARTEKVAIVGGSTFGRYKKISSAKTINMFISEAEGQKWFVNTSGYARILNLLAQGEGRGLMTSIRGNIMVTVIGANVYKIDSNLQPTLIGQLNTEVGEVYMAENLNAQVCIVDGVNAYIYNYNLGSLTVQSLSGSLVPNYVEFHNTRFLFGNGDLTSNGAAWYVYDVTSPTTIGQINQFALQTKADFALAVVRIPSQASNVLVMGKSVCEVWTQIGGLQNYRKDTNVSIDYGVASISTIDQSDKFIVWLATNENQSPVIMVYSGQNAEPISGDGINYELSQVKFPADSTAMFYREDGHLIYQLTFYNAADNFTLIFDFNTKMFFHLSDWNLNYHPARDYAFFMGKNYFVNLNSAALYNASTDLTTYDENVPGASDPLFIHEIQRIRICETVRADDSSQFAANSFVFTIEQGNDENVTDVSLENNIDYLVTEYAFVQPESLIYTEFGTPIVDEDSGAGVGLGNLPPPYQPRVDLSISLDGGDTWSNTVGRGLNPVGKRQNILNWEGLGLCNSSTLKLRFWGTSRFVCYDGILEII